MSLKLPHLYHEQTTIVRRPERTFHSELDRWIDNEPRYTQGTVSLTDLGSSTTAWTAVPNLAKVKIKPIWDIPPDQITLNYYTTALVTTASAIRDVSDLYAAIPIRMSPTLDNWTSDEKFWGSTQHYFCGLPISIIPSGQDLRLSMTARYRVLNHERGNVKPIICLIGSGPTGRYIDTNFGETINTGNPGTATAFLPTHYKAEGSYWFPHIHHLPVRSTTLEINANQRYAEYQVDAASNLLFLSGSDTSYWFCLGFEMKYLTRPSSSTVATYVGNISMTIDVDDLLYVPKYTKPFGQP